MEAGFGFAELGFEGFELLGVRGDGLFPAPRGISGCGVVRGGGSVGMEAHF